MGSEASRKCQLLLKWRRHMVNPFRQFSLRSLFVAVSTWSQKTGTFYFFAATAAIRKFCPLGNNRT